jgi:hypothetical protein
VACTFHFYGPSAAVLKAGKVYTLTGELAAYVEPTGPGAAQWQPSGGLAAGVYVVVLESVLANGDHRRQVVKVSLLR